MIDHYHLSEQDQTALNSTMREQGYRRIIGAMDTFFCRKDFLTNNEWKDLRPFSTHILAWTWADNHNSGPQ
jgi:hypothetical protein